MLNQQGRITHLHNEENDRRHASRYTGDRPESVKNEASKLESLCCLTWIERRLFYPEFEPCDHRHSNANPNEHERVREPLPSRVGLECPIHIHTPKGDKGRKAETHDAVNIRLYHPTKRFGRIIIYSTA